MSLQLPSFTPPYSATPIQNAYAWIANLLIDFRAMSGSLMMSIDASASDAAAGYPPIQGIAITLGQTLVPVNGNTPAVTFPTLQELLADPEFAQAFGVIRTKLYTQLLNHSTFAGSTEVA